MENAQLETYTKVGVIILCTISVVCGFFMKLISVETFLAIVGPIIGYYFSEKKNDKLLKQNSEVIEQLRLQLPVEVKTDEEI